MQLRIRLKKWTFEALMRVKDRITFDVLGIDSDNLSADRQMGVSLSMTIL